MELKLNIKGAYTKELIMFFGEQYKAKKAQIEALQNELTEIEDYLTQLTRATVHATTSAAINAGQLSIISPNGYDTTMPWYKKAEYVLKGSEGVALTTAQIVEKLLTIDPSLLPKRAVAISNISSVLGVMAKKSQVFTKGTNAKNEITYGLQEWYKD